MRAPDSQFCTLSPKFLLLAKALLRNGTLSLDKIEARHFIRLIRFHFSITHRIRDITYPLSKSQEKARRLANVSELVSCGVGSGT